MPATYEPIASQTLGSGATTVTFSSIPGAYTDLILVSSGKDNMQAQTRGMRFNGDTGSNYSRTYFFGNGSTAISGRDSAFHIALPTDTTQYTEVFHIASYANTNVFKTALYNASMPGYLAARMVSLWRSTAAITSIEVFCVSAGLAFESGRTFTLYGIKAA